MTHLSERIHLMRKTFPLEVPGLKPPRVIDSIKNEVRKYLKRERRKILPDEADFWDFSCQIGPDSDSPKAAHVKEINAAIDTAARENWNAIYIEILAKPGRRTRKNPESPPES